MWSLKWGWSWLTSLRSWELHGFHFQGAGACICPPCTKGQLDVDVNRRIEDENNEHENISRYPGKSLSGPFGFSLQMRVSPNGQEGSSVLKTYR